MMAGMKKREVATRLMYSFHCQAALKSIQHWTPYSGAFSGTARWYMKMIGTEKATLRVQEGGHQAHRVLSQTSARLARMLM